MVLYEWIRQCSRRTLTRLPILTLGQVLKEILELMRASYLVKIPKLSVEFAKFIKCDFKFKLQVMLKMGLDPNLIMWDQKKSCRMRQKKMLLSRRHLLKWDSHKVTPKAKKCVLGSLGPNKVGRGPYEVAVSSFYIMLFHMKSAALTWIGVLFPVFGCITSCYPS